MTGKTILALCHGARDQLRALRKCYLEGTIEMLFMFSERGSISLRSTKCFAFCLLETDIEPISIHGGQG